MIYSLGLTREEIRAGDRRSECFQSMTGCFINSEKWEDYVRRAGPIQVPTMARTGTIQVTTMARAGPIQVTTHQHGQGGWANTGHHHGGVLGQYRTPLTTMARTGPYSRIVLAFFSIIRTKLDTRVINRNQNVICSMHL